MLQAAHAYTKLPASDMLRARRFYVEVLGFRPTSESDRHLWFDTADGSSITVFLSSGKASGDHDQCGLVVDDFGAVVAELRRRGIVFQEFPGYTFVGGIAVEGAWRAVWFRDSEGNLLNVRSTARHGE
jgi:extradiol dioxygenase family protein